MTARMTAQKVDSSRVSFRRAGLGALLAATLLAGGLIGAAVYAGIDAATTQRAMVSVTLPVESTVVRNLRIAAGRGQLIGDSVGGETTATNLPSSGDLQDDRPGDAPSVEMPHAPGRGPLP